jgi:hypothetical protein
MLCPLRGPFAAGQKLAVLGQFVRLFRKSPTLLRQRQQGKSQDHKILQNLNHDR